MTTTHLITKTYSGFFSHRKLGSLSRTKQAGQRLKMLRAAQGKMLEPGETSVELLRNNRPSGNI